MNETVKDPVCHMQVPATSFATEFATEYARIHYAFCSAQCMERFLSNPHLYVGLPGHKAPAQQGKKVIKGRRLVLSTPLDAMQAAQVRRVLSEMMGIHEISIEGDKIEIQYDLMQVTAEQIADKLGLIGADLGGGWKDHLKLAFINYLEECEIGSLEVENKKGHY
jgi:YHS domain-containing protein